MSKRPRERERDEIEREKREREEIEWQKRERERLAQIRRHLSGRRFSDKSPLIDLITEIDRDLDPTPLLSLSESALTKVLQDRHTSFSPRGRRARQARRARR